MQPLLHHRQRSLHPAQSGIQHLHSSIFFELPGTCGLHDAVLYKLAMKERSLRCITASAAWIPLSPAYSTCIAALSLSSQ